VDLTNQQWALLQPLILDAQGSSAEPGGSSRGRPPIDDRLVLDAILWKFRNRAAWYVLPALGLSSTGILRKLSLSPYFGDLWRRQGLLALYDDLLQRGFFDLRSALQESSLAVVQKGSSYRILSATELHGTWQLSTALVFIQIALTRLKRNSP
jgi:transposase